MVSSLAAVTVNYINTKLKMEDTLEENIYSECANLRGCVVQIVLEIRTNGIYFNLIFIIIVIIII
jgi:hypothetical protein